MDQKSTGSVSDTQAKIVRHPKFYFEDRLVTIQIENTLFTVNKRILDQSETFSDMFKVPIPADSDIAEGTREIPIKLLGVAASDFECLLTVLYAPHFSTKRPEIKPSLIVPAYRLADKWNFRDLCDYLLPIAGAGLHGIDKILFAREFGPMEWLVPAHVELYKRQDKITTEEAVKLGVHSVLLLYHLHQTFHPRGNGTSQFLCMRCAGHSCYGGSRVCSKCRTQTHTVQMIDHDEHDRQVRSEVERWVKNGCIL